MEYIVACHDPTLLAALRAFAAALALLPDPRDRRGVRHPLPVLLATLIVALAGGANSRAAVAAFTHDHQAWFRLWLPLGETTPSRDTYLRLVHRLETETAMQAALLELVRGHWGVENGLHRTLDVQFREDDCRLHTGNGPAVMGIFRRAALNRVRTVQQNLGTHVSIGLLRDRIGRHPWILAAALP